MDNKKKSVIQHSIAKTGEITFVGPDKSIILAGKDVKAATAYINSNNENTVGLTLIIQVPRNLQWQLKSFLVNKYQYI